MPTKTKSRKPSPSPSPVVDLPHPPEPADIREALGRSAAAWDELRARISKHFGEVTEIWDIPARKYGWSLRLRQNKRTIVHLSPRSKHFTAAIILGKRATAAVRRSKLDPEAIALVEQATKYKEGRAVRFEIRFKKDTEVVEALAKIKMAF
ncbi:MAG TPA: DUF3788 family protein [Desulfosarcina sp.]|nr:DUF3788 family protein [Desulfosarcina sp.]